MNIENWKYYNHAAIPTTPPNVDPDLNPVNSGAIWNICGGTPLLCRWTTDFDCGYETNWWYVIKDEPFNLSQLKAKRRYEINKGNKNFFVKRITATDYKEELYNVQVNALSAYPDKYRPIVDKEEFINQISSWGEYTVFGAFSRDSGELAGYAFLTNISTCFVDFSVLKTNPKYEKYGVNAALVYGILEYYNDFLKNNGLICDGSRSINHETFFQDYLEKYFGFRKAYSKLHIVYNYKIAFLIRLLYPIRKFLLRFDKIGIAHQVNSILKMEEISRSEV